MERNTTAGDHKRVITRLSGLACLLALGGGLALAAPGAAHAQLSGMFGTTTGPRLNQEDTKLAGAAVKKLLDEKPATVGHYEQWSNPGTGNHGKFTIMSIYTAHGLPCRKVNSQVVYGKSNIAPRTVSLGACQVASGQWKTAE